MKNTKTAIVTGAGKGMGAAIARELRAEGYQLVLMSRTREQVAALGAELEAEWIAGSVTSNSDLQSLVELTLDSFGRIDALVNSTGHCPKGDLLEIPDEDWHAGFELVLLNVARTARLVTPVMTRQGGGSIVNISTYAAFEPSPVYPVSSVIRAALGSYVKLFADRYASDNVRMNNILPGCIDSQQFSTEVADSIPMKRLGKVKEIAQTAAFLLSPGAGYITGQNIRVDGSLTRSV